MTTIAEVLTSAVRHHGAGRLADAEHLYRQILAVAPDHPDALHLLGVIANQVGRHDLSAELIGRSVAIRPGFAEAHYNLGLALQALTRWDEAIASYDLALALKPDHAVAHNNRANALKSLGRFDEAVAGYGRAITLRPDYAEAHNNLGICLHDDLKRLDEAAASYRRALALDPHLPDAHNALGAILVMLGSFPEALEHFRSAVAAKPEMAAAHNNVGLVEKTLGRIDAAIASFDRAVALNGDAADVRANRAKTLLVAGRLKEAWQDYEWRWKDAKLAYRRPFMQPWWDGRAIVPKELLIWTEQGLADEIMGITMLPDAMALAGHCVVECDRRLVALVARSFPAATVIGREDPPNPRALEAEYQTPADDLPRYFRNDPGDFPTDPTVLVPDPIKAAHRKRWIEGLGPGLKVGLSWRGRLIGPQRSRFFAPIERLAPILQVPGVVFVNLQYDDSAADIETIRALTGVVVHSAEDLDLTNDLDGVAALMAGLDAVVGPATAVGDLAGALGRPTWMYAYYPVSAEKTICGTDHVPWYPSVRLETCAYGEDWGGAVGRIAASIGAFAETRVRRQ